jgi:FtsK/SpoIIIE family
MGSYKDGSRPDRRRVGATTMPSATLVRQLSDELAHLLRVRDRAGALGRAVRAEIEQSLTVQRGQLLRVLDDAASHVRRELDSLTEIGPFGSRADEPRVALEDAAAFVLDAFDAVVAVLQPEADEIDGEAATTMLRAATEKLSDVEAAVSTFHTLIERLDAFLRFQLADLPPSSMMDFIGLRGAIGKSIAAVVSGDGEVHRSGQDITREIANIISHAERNRDGAISEAQRTRDLAVAAAQRDLQHARVEAHQTHANETASAKNATASVVVERERVRADVLEAVKRARLDVRSYRPKLRFAEATLIGAARMFGSKLPLYQRSWIDAEWQRFRPPSVPPRDVQAASLRIGHRRFDVSGTAVELPFLLPFLGASHLAVVDESNQGRALPVAIGLLCRLLATYPAGLLRLDIFDRRDIGQHFRVFTNALPGELVRVLHKVSELDSTLDELLADAKQELARLPVNDPSILELATRTNARKRATIVVLKDYDEAKFEAHTAELIEAIQRQGHRVGVHLLLLPTRSDRASRDIATLRVTDQGAELAMAGGGTRPFRLDPRLSDAAAQRFVRAVAASFDAPDYLAISLLEALPASEAAYKESSSSRLRADIGYTDESRPFSIDFDSQRDIHALIVGDTGTGKSSLLHIIIATLAMRYSPDELRLVMLDDKEGSEFSFYEQLLPHLRLLELNRDAYFARTILDDFAARMRDRQALFADAHVSDLTEYRRAFPAAIMPRELLIWDDLREAVTHDEKLSDEIVRLLTEIAARGRSAGFHLLLAMPSLTQVEHRLKPVLQHVKQHLQLTDPGHGSDGKTWRARVPRSDRPDAARPDASDILIRLLRFDKSRERPDLRARLKSVLLLTGRSEPRPKVLRGDRLASLPPEIPRETDGTPTPRFYLGERVDAGDVPMSITLGKEFGANTLFVGSADVIGRLFEFAFVAAARGAAKAGGVVYACGLSSRVAALPRALAACVRPAGPEEIAAVLEEEARHSLVFIRDLVQFTSRLGRERRTKPLEAMKRLPLDGGHVMAWSPTVAGLSDLSFDGPAAIFGFRVVSAQDDASLRALDPRSAAPISPTRGWLFPPHGEPVMFVPYHIDESALVDVEPEHVE